MRYSCFNPTSGLYDLYEDSTQLPVNGDLPVPKLASQAGKVGVPAIDCGRPLPVEARHVGTSWHADGFIVQCRGQLSGYDESPGSTSLLWIAGAAAAAALVYVLLRKN